MKYLDLRKRIRAPLFTRHDLRLFKAKVLDYQLSLWQRDGHLVKIRNGLYVFDDQFQHISPEELAQPIYAPSYISLEKALSLYGLIPEMVYAVTSVTPKTTRHFTNRAGTFLYRHIQPRLFFGYREVRGKNLPYIMAEPEKALLDFIYFHRHQMKSRGELAEFRLNEEAIRRELSKQKIKKYLDQFAHHQIEQIVQWFWRTK